MNKETFLNLRPTNLNTPLSVVTVREINYSHKDITIPVGTKLDLYFLWEKPSRVTFEYNGEYLMTSSAGCGKTYKILNKNVPSWKKQPSFNTISKWEWDSGTCKTILGKIVEPDGFDEFGSPSWMQALEMI